MYDPEIVNVNEYIRKRKVFRRDGLGERERFWRHMTYTFKCSQLEREIWYTYRS